MSNNKHGAGSEYTQPDASAPKGFAEDHEPVAVRAQQLSTQAASDVDLAKLTESLGVTVRAAVEEHVAAGRTVYGIGSDGRIVGTRR